MTPYYEYGLKNKKFYLNKSPSAKELGSVSDFVNKDKKSIRSLNPLFNISSIGPKIKGSKDHSFNNPDDGVTVFFGRDRGEKQSDTNISKNREDLLKGRNRWSGGTEYMYIWSVKEKKWYYVSRYSNPKDWKELKMQEKFYPDMAEFLIVLMV